MGRNRERGKLGKDIANQMKGLSVALLLLGLTGCKYGSMEQASVACREWATKGQTISYRYNDRTDWRNIVEKERSSVNRNCKLEKETNQFLGREGSFSEEDLAKEGTNVDWYFDGPEATDFKVVKNFRY